MSDKLTVMILTAGEIYGGVERQVLDLCDYAVRMGNLRYVPALFHDGELASALRERGIEPVLLKSRHRYDLGACRDLGRTLADRGCDVIHAHGYRAMVTLAAAHRMGVSIPGIIKTEHGLAEPTHGRPLQTFKTLLNQKLDRWATNLMQATVCYVTDDIRHRYGEDHQVPDRVTVCNGIDVLDSEYYERPDDLPKDGINVVIVGRLSQVKGIEYALEALKLKDMPEQVRLILIGTGPLSEALKAEAAPLGDRVLFTGFRRNVYQYLNHADALLMPSLHEGLPYTLLESMSLGLPVIASRVGGLAEVVEDERTGLLIPARDPAAIAHACMRIVEEKGLVERLGENAAVLQRERYTLSDMAEEYMRIYRTRLAG